MNYIFAKFAYLKTHKLISISILSIWGLILAFIYSNNVKINVNPDYRFLSYIILIVISNVLVVDYFKTRRQTYRGYRNFFSLNSYKVLLFQILTIYLLNLFYDEFLILFILIYFLFLVPAIIYFIIILIAFIYKFLFNSQRNEKFEDKSEGSHLVIKHPRNESLIIESKAIIKTLLVQLLLNEETTLKNLVLKTAKELDIGLDYFSINNDLYLYESHESNHIQQILYAIQEFLDENVIEYEFIRLRDSIRKIN